MIINTISPQEAEFKINNVRQKGMEEVKRLSFDSLNNIKLVFGEPVIYEFNIEGILFEIFAHFEENSPYLIVFNPARVNRKKHQLPFFHRWSWGIKSGYSSIVMNDPTLYLDNLEIGWFQGLEEKYYLPLACEIVMSLAKQLNLFAKDILFCGSSAGGFSSLMMAGFVRQSSAFVINPQTNAFNFSKLRVEELLKSSFSGINREEAKKRYAIRFSVPDYYRSQKYVPRIFYMQNASDVNHWKNHYLPLIETVGEMIANDELPNWLDKLLIQSEIYCHGDHVEGTKAVTYEHWIERVKTFMKSNDIRTPTQ
jgi:hypothetical protein